MAKQPVDLSKILFFDIETACIVRDFHDLTTGLKKEWEKRANRFVRLHEYPLSEDEITSFYMDKAAIYAEFARVICISMGILTSNNGQWQLRVKSFADSSEADLLKEFSNLINAHFFDPGHNVLCGHNIREFDVPFLCRRMLINRIPLPVLLDISGLKPWQVGHLQDTLELWKFGDYKHYTSLDLLCSVFGVASPKSNLSGDQVNNRYWEGGLNDIISYCEDDLIATVKVFLRLGSYEFVENLEISRVSNSSENNEEE